MSALGQEAPIEGRAALQRHFMGADSTGKSELVKYVARAYGMRKVPETAQRASRGLHAAQLARAQHGCRRVSAHGVRSPDRAGSSYAASIRRGSGLDNLAYASEYGRCFGELARAKRCRSTSRRSGRMWVFLVRPHRALRAEDGVRVLPSWEEQQRLDAKIELLLQLWGVPHVVIAENSAARREEQIDWCLAARGSQNMDEQSQRP